MRGGRIVLWWGARCGVGDVSVDMIPSGVGVDNVLWGCSVGLSPFVFLYTVLKPRMVKRIGGVFFSL